MKISKKQYYFLAFLFSSLFYFIENYNEKAIGEVLLKSVVFGFIIGLIYEIFIVNILNKLIENSIQSIKFKTLDNEKILFEEKANIIKSYNAIGGKLFVTNKRIVFISHNYNFKKTELYLDISEIKLINKEKNKINLKYKIQTENNGSYVFLVMNELSEEIINLINNEKKKFTNKFK